MKVALAVLGASVVLAACATGPREEEHAAHHAPAAATAPTPGQMDAMMKSMQQMHDRMAAAKTPEERARLMQQHTQLMHEGLGMMGRMRHGQDGMAMDRRMDMMEMMMQMMMDREAAR